MRKTPWTLEVCPGMCRAWETQPKAQSEEGESMQDFCPETHLEVFPALQLVTSLCVTLSFM